MNLLYPKFTSARSAKRWRRILRTPMNFLYPKFPFKLLPAMLKIAAAGMLVAGFYGIVHDQITYSISREYYTKLKFSQFSYAAFGFHPRVFVATIGFLATWWVGFFSGWFLARILVPKTPEGFRKPIIIRGFSMIFVSALIAALIGWGMATAGYYDLARWTAAVHHLGVKQVPDFVTVAYIHNGSYLGGLIGLLVALIDAFLRRKKFLRAGFS